MATINYWLYAEIEDGDDYINIEIPIKVDASALGCALPGYGDDIPDLEAAIKYHLDEIEKEEK